MAGRKKKLSKKYARRRRKYRILRVLKVIGVLIVILLVIVGVSRIRAANQTKSAIAQSTQTPGSEESGTVVIDGLELNVQLLTINEYSRPGIALDKINSIVIHYTANPGSGAMANRNYFEGLKDSHATKASAHFIVGLDGEIVQCIPTSEIAYASNDRNSDTVSIECCYENEDGSFREATYDSLVHLTAWLCNREGLTSEDVIRHYDITGKMCPLYYVEHPDDWEQFRADVSAEMKQL